jgi:hypothetical protein
MLLSKTIDFLLDGANLQPISVEAAEGGADAKTEDAPETK